MKELTSFHYLFQVTKQIIFQVDYYRLGNNTHKHFSTAATELSRNKSGIVCCGQAQDELLKEHPQALFFYLKHDSKHLKDLTPAQHQEMLQDLEQLKQRYNYLEKIDADRGFNFYAEQELSKEPLKDTATDVVFRIYPDSETVIALFPYLVENRRSHLIQSYIHDGQHVPAYYEAVIQQTRPATPAEYHALQQELEKEVGYELRIIKKRSYSKFCKAYDQTN
jgi:hypothetical protein